MDIEKLLKKKHPDWSNQMIRYRRIEGFNRLYGSQQKYLYYKNKKYSPQIKSIQQMASEFGIEPEKIMNFKS